MEPVYLAEIYIRQVRHLQNIKIDLSHNEKKHLLLTGIGMSTRDIHDQIQELYGMELSAEMVSKITDRILPEI